MEQPPDTAATLYNAEQLDALLAQIALYPDELLTQVLMASTYPLQIVNASRWLAQDNNKALTGEALAQALQAQNWDPSVKSLVPFPQVLEMLNSNLDWTQQLGYAFATQQNGVWNSIQRLRVQAQAVGQLKSTEQQTVAVESGAIVIQPANPQVVYVPTYNPSVVYGAWPYPSYPPVYYPPPPGYVVGSAFMTGLAFAAGVAVVGSLWGWCGPRWSGGYGSWGGSVNVNANRYNNINVNRPPLQQGGWRPPAAGGLPAVRRVRQAVRSGWRDVRHSCRLTRSAGAMCRCRGTSRGHSNSPLDQVARPAAGRRAATRSGQAPLSVAGRRSRVLALRSSGRAARPRGRRAQASSRVVRSVV